MAYAQTFDKLTAISLDTFGHSQTCNYWYVVQQYHGPHTAFQHRENFIKWLDLLGLKLREELPAHGTHKVMWIEGTYRTQMHMSYDEFYALEGVHTRTLSNGSYTLGIVTTDEDGIKTLHSLNPNCKHRHEFDYQESRAMVG
ncbi:hypothetical protein [Paraburkholderia sp. GAS32]|uniref:hypothetical protein n=1 Tax=Paraburkholderia sp. GAS32 TaxID=3035129 RepID=UPI003D22DEC9